MAEIDSCTVVVNGFLQHADPAASQLMTPEKLITKFFKNFKIRDIRIPTNKQKLVDLAFIELDSPQTAEAVVKKFNISNKRVEREEKPKELGFAMTSQADEEEVEEDEEDAGVAPVTGGITVMMKSVWQEKKLEVKNEGLNKVSMSTMVEATKDMMNDDECPLPEGGVMDSFVKLDFSKSKDIFKTSSELRDFIYRVTCVKPQFTDLQSQSAILRFSKRVESEYCVKKLLDIKL